MPAEGNSAACTACGKPAAQVEQLRALGDWECSHTDCPTRRRCWSEQVHAPRREAVLHLDAGVAALFDNVDAAAARVMSMATGCELCDGMPSVCVPARGALNPNDEGAIA